MQQKVEAINAAANERIALWEPEKLNKQYVPDEQDRNNISKIAHLSHWSRMASPP